MCTDSDGHIWALPWIEQLGAEKTAIQTIGNMSFINTKWLNFLGLSMPTTVDEFEQVLMAFRDNAASIKAEYGIDGDIIPMSCIVNNGDQDPSILINGFGEGYGDADKDRHIAVTNCLLYTAGAGGVSGEADRTEVDDFGSFQSLVRNVLLAQHHVSVCLLYTSRCV